MLSIFYDAGETSSFSSKIPLIFRIHFSKQNEVFWYGLCCDINITTVEKGVYMIDRSNAGRRCRTNQLVRTVEGDLTRAATGTIRYEMENLGRSLVMVDWDKGFTVPVFPHEIEVLVEKEAHP